ncbi:MAG: DoxX family protein [Betaproteobacteria bacterium]|nr:DoxX family protein [Betaproteobacteria bacterium]
MNEQKRSDMALMLIRLALAGLIAAHGWARLIGGGVVPFGNWLDSQGIPFGFAVAAAVTAIEIIGTPLLALRRWVLSLAIAYAAIYVVGIVMVHAKAGWFVVGLGRNGSEYSVLLIVCLLAMAWRDLPSRWAR